MELTHPYPPPRPAGTSQMFQAWLRSQAKVTQRAGCSFPAVDSVLEIHCLQAYRLTQEAAIPLGASLHQVIFYSPPEEETRGDWNPDKLCWVIWCILIAGRITSSFPLQSHRKHRRSPRLFSHLASTAMQINRLFRKILKKVYTTYSLSWPSALGDWFGSPLWWLR